MMRICLLISSLKLVYSHPLPIVIPVQPRFPWIPTARDKSANQSGVQSVPYTFWRAIAVSLIGLVQSHVSGYC